MEKESVNREAEGMRSLQQLIKLLKDALSRHNIWLTRNDKTKKAVGGGSMFILKWINLYERMTKLKGASFVKDHAPLFITLYENLRSEFLNVEDDDNFLSSNSLQIWYGENDPRHRSLNVKLPISVCYGKAMEMKTEESKKINGDPENDSRVMENINYVIAGEIKHSLMLTIFYSLEPDAKDAARLEVIIKNLRDGTTLEGSEDNTIPGLSMGSVVRKALGSMGLNVGEINGTQIESAIGAFSNVMNDKELSGGIKSAMSEASKSRPATVSESILNVVKRVGPLIDEKISSNLPEGVTISPNSQGDNAPSTDEMWEQVEKFTSALGGGNKPQ